MSASAISFRGLIPDKVKSGNFSESGLSYSTFKILSTLADFDNSSSPDSHEVVLSAVKHFISTSVQERDHFGYWDYLIQIALFSIEDQKEVLASFFTDALLSNHLLQLYRDMEAFPFEAEEDLASNYDYLLREQARAILVVELERIKKLFDCGAFQEAKIDFLVLLNQFSKFADYGIVLDNEFEDRDDPAMIVNPKLSYQRILQYTINYPQWNLSFFIEAFEQDIPQLDLLYRKLRATAIKKDPAMKFVAI